MSPGGSNGASTLCRCAMVLRGLALGTTYKDVWSRWAVSAAAALNLAWPECTDASDRGRGALVSRKGAYSMRLQRRTWGRGVLGMRNPQVGPNTQASICGRRPSVHEPLRDKVASPTSRSTNYVAIALVLAIAVGLAGCGGSGNGSQPSTPGAPPGAEPTAGPPPPGGPTVPPPLTAPTVPPTTESPIDESTTSASDQSDPTPPP